MITAGGNNESNPFVSTVRFRDGTALESAEYVEDFHVRKRFRASEEGVFDQNLVVEGDLIVRGTATLDRGDDDDTTHLSTKIDDLYFKIGWDTTLSRWKHTHFTNVDTASLDYRLQELDFSNYYTKAQTDNAIYFSNTFGWENYTGTGSDNFLLHNPYVNDEFVHDGPHIVLTANTSLVIPWGDNNGTPHRFIIQNSHFGTGKVLTSDAYGVATWQDIGTVASVPQEIQTSIGPTQNEPSFKINDSSTADYAFYPNKIGNNYEICQDGDFVTHVTQGAYSIFAGKGSNITRPTGIRMSNTDGSLTLFGGDELSENAVWMKTGATYNGTYLGNTIQLDHLGVHITHAKNQHIHLHGWIHILPKSLNHPHYNKNPETEQARLHIGTAGSGQGNLIVENKITAKALQIPTGSIVNHVLTCDAEGNASWQPTQGTSLVTNFSDDVTMVNLSTSGMLSTQEFTIANGGNTLSNPYTPHGIGWTNGSHLSKPHPLSFGGQTRNVELGRAVTYGSDTVSKTIGQITIPANYRGNIKIHVPLYVQHQYNYKWRQSQSQYANQPQNETAFHFFLPYVQVVWREEPSDLVVAEHTYFEETSFEEHKRTLGSVYIQHHRDYSQSKLGNGFFPYLDKHKWEIKDHHFFGPDRNLKGGDKVKHTTTCKTSPSGTQGEGGNSHTCSTHGHRGNSHGDFFDSDGTHTYHHILEVEDLQIQFAPPIQPSSKTYSLQLNVRIGYNQQGPSLYNGSYSYANTLAQRYPHMTLSFGDFHPYLINWWRWGSPTEGIVHIKDIETGLYVITNTPFWSVDQGLPFTTVINPPYPLLPYFNLRNYPQSTPQFGHKGHNEELWNINHKKYVAFTAWDDSKLHNQSFRQKNAPAYNHIVSTSLEDGGYQPYNRVISYMKILHNTTIAHLYIRGAYSTSNSHIEEQPLDNNWAPENNLEGYVYSSTLEGYLSMRILRFDHFNHLGDPVYHTRLNSNQQGVQYLSYTLNELKSTYPISTNLSIVQFPRSPYFGFEEYKYVPSIPSHSKIDLFANRQLLANQFMNPDAHIRHLQIGSLYVSNFQARHIDTPNPIRCRGIYTRSYAKTTPLLNEIGDTGNIITWNWNESNLETFINDQLVHSVVPNYSDHRLKIDIQHGCPCEVFPRLEELSLFQYTLLPLVDNDEKSTNHFGFYAHELQSLFPEFPHLVNGKKNDPGKYQTINYNQLVILSIQALKEAKGEITKVKKEVKKLKESLFEIQLSISLLAILLFILCYLLSYPLLHFFFPSLFF